MDHRNSVSLAALYGIEESVFARLRDQVRRTDATGIRTFTCFLTPSEVAASEALAGMFRIACSACGGYEGCERKIVCFHDPAEEVSTQDFDIAALRIDWPHQPAAVKPGHRDLLGAAIGTGLSRDTMGDILIRENDAVFFVQERVAEHLSGSLTSAGRAQLRVERITEPVEAVAAAGTLRHCTVASLRLDALLAAVCHMSRGEAAERITGGDVKLRYNVCMKGDAKAEPGDVVSIRGVGRFCIKSCGEENRKGRIPVDAECFGF